MENLVILVRMEVQVQSDHQDSLELQETLVLEERRVTVEKASLDPGDHQDLLDHLLHPNMTDLPLSIWRDLVSLTWNLLGAFQGYLDHQVLQDLQALFSMKDPLVPQLVHKDPRGRMEPPVNRADQAHQVLMVAQEL